MSFLIAVITMYNDVLCCRGSGGVLARTVYFQENEQGKKPIITQTLIKRLQGGASLGSQGGFVWGGKIRGYFLKEVTLGAPFIHRSANMG